MLTRRALITGLEGQDGSYLAELLVAQGYEVFGIIRQPRQYSNLDDVRDQVALTEADLLDQPSLVRALRHAHPSEVYNLASASFVPISWQEPVLTAQFAAVGVTFIVEAIREVDPSIRFYQASSSEIFGEPREVPQSEETPLSPRTPYGVAKAYGQYITASYRPAHGTHASSGILDNHESPRRPSDFLPQKIARAVAGIKLGLREELVVGDLDASRDWGVAGDYVRSMSLMLQQDEPADYVIATGETHSVLKCVQHEFARIGREWRRYVRPDVGLRRGNAELHDLVSDPRRARKALGWRPAVAFPDLIAMLVDAALRSLQSASAEAKVRT